MEKLPPTPSSSQISSLPESSNFLVRISQSRVLRAIAAIMGIGAGATACGGKEPKPARCYQPENMPVAIGVSRHEGEQAPYAVEVAVKKPADATCWTPPYDIQLEGDCMTKNDTAMRETYGQPRTRYQEGTEVMHVTPNHPGNCVVPMDVWGRIIEQKSGETFSTNGLSLMGDQPQQPQPKSPDGGI